MIDNWFVFLRGCVLAWDQHNLIILLCKAWEQHKFHPAPTNISNANKSSCSTFLNFHKMVTTSTVTTSTCYVSTNLSTSTWHLCSKLQIIFHQLYIKKESGALRIIFFFFFLNYVKFYLFWWGVLIKTHRFILKFHFICAHSLLRQKLMHR